MIRIREGAMTVQGSETNWRHPQDHPLRRLISDNRAALGSLAVFLAMLLIFTIANPKVFTTWALYSSVFTTLPVAIFLTVPLVFIVTVGELDLSFPATMGLRPECLCWS
jgi:simple sugar transport system permease protein